MECQNARKLLVKMPRVQKYIHVGHPDNWNTHNLQSIESPQNTQTHRTLKYTSQPTHWNSKTPYAYETPKPSSPGKHSDRSVHWNTLIKSIETCNSPSPLKHPSVALPNRILFNETNYTNSLSPPPQTLQKQHMQKNTTKIEWVSLRLSSRSPPPPSFLAMQHLKHLNGISLVGRWLLDIVCWLG